MFEVMLRFVYTDKLPEVEEEDGADDAVAMAWALLLRRCGGTSSRG